MGFSPQPNRWQCGPFALKHALVMLGILALALYAYAGQLLGLYLSAGCLTLYFFSQYHPAHQVMDSVLRLAGLFVPPGVTVLAVRRGYCCTWPEAWQSLGYIVLISIAVWFLWALINSPAT